MSWERVLLDAQRESLAARIESLLEQQRGAWPLFRDGEAALAQLRTKTLVDGAAAIVVQANPARRRSTHAKIDAKSIAARACFLCPENMPPEERGVAFENLVIMPNPFPILPMHCTVADREHRPQQITGRVRQLLALATAVGPQLAVFYNGARCGASAPDHFHFQTCSATGIPLLKEMESDAGSERGALHRSFGRSVVAFRGSDASQIEASANRLLARLPVLEPAGDDREQRVEPMVNVIGHYADGRLSVLVFPRRAHRPQCYFAEGAARLAISPAALEMAGLLVAAEVEDVDRIDAASARAIYAEVSHAPEQLEKLIRH